MIRVVSPLIYQFLPFDHFLDHQRTNSMDDYDLPAAERRTCPSTTPLEIENTWLRKKIKSLESLNHDLEVCVKAQYKQIKNLERLEHLEGRSDWDNFEESVLKLRENQVNDAVNTLEELRRQFNDRRESSRQDEALQTDLRAQFLADENRFTPNTHHKPRPHHGEQCVAVENKPTVTTSKTNGMKHSATQPINAVAQTELRRKLRQRRSFQNLRRVASGRELAARFNGFIDLFKKDKKVKKDGREKRKSDTLIEEEDGTRQAVPKPVIHTITNGHGNITQHDAQHQAVCMVSKEEHHNQQMHKPHIRSNLNRYQIAGTHEPDPCGWKLHEAQEEYMQSLEDVAAAPPSPVSSIKIVVTGVQHGTKCSREIEAGITAAMERDITSFPPRKGEIRHTNWPEGSRARDEEVFNGTKVVTGQATASVTNGGQFKLPRTDGYRLNQAPSDGYLLQPAHRCAASRRSLPIDQKRIHRKTRLYYPSPASPPPDRPLPAIPERLSPAVPATIRPLSQDDVFGSGPRTPTGNGVMHPTLRHRARRNSEPSPTPRMITFRPKSPSPGGNGPLGEVGQLGWMGN